LSPVLVTFEHGVFVFNLGAADDSSSQDDSNADATGNGDDDLPNRDRGDDSNEDAEFTVEEELLFAKCYEEGYDLFDQRYMDWLKINHAENWQDKTPPTMQPMSLMIHASQSGEKSADSEAAAFSQPGTSCTQNSASSQVPPASPLSGLLKSTLTQVSAVTPLLSLPSASGVAPPSQLSALALMPPSQPSVTPPSQPSTTPPSQPSAIPPSHPSASAATTPSQPSATPPSQPSTIPPSQPSATSPSHPSASAATNPSQPSASAVMPPSPLSASAVTPPPIKASAVMSLSVTPQVKSLSTSTITTPKQVPVKNKHSPLSDILNLPIPRTAQKVKTGRARVLTRAECLDALKEKEEQKKREAEEKRQRAEERLLKRRQKEEELKQKREERARKAEERALKAKEKAEERAFKEKEKAEQRALKAKEGKGCKVQNDAAQGRATKRQQVAGRCGSVSGVVRQTRPLRKKAKLDDDESINTDICCVCFGSYKDDDGTGRDWVQCCGRWIHEDCMDPDPQNSEKLCPLC